MPFYAFAPEVRRIVYTTNAIEALNAKLRRAVRARGHFPNDEAAAKLLFLVLNRTEKTWEAGSQVGHGKSAVRRSVRRALHTNHGVTMVNRPLAHGIPDSPVQAPALPNRPAKDHASVAS